MMFESDSSEEDEEITNSSTPLTVDQPLSIQLFDSGKNDVVYESADYIDSKSVICKTPYDKNAWRIVLDEVEKTENKATILDTYASATTQFPRTASLWIKYTHFLVRYGEIQQAEDAYRKSLIKCRSVELWDRYLNLVRSKTVSQHPPGSDEYANNKKTYESAFENAIENVGLSLTVNVIWRKYLDFVLEWPEAREADSGRKLTVLRELYQRAVASPMDQLDNFWREYEEWEMKAGKHLAEQLLPEFKKKFLDARNVYKERKKLHSSIDLSFMASPPSMEYSVAEAKQLQLWNNLIKSEVKNTLDSPDALRKALLDMLFDRFLSCFYLHPEAWMMLARYQMQFYSVTEARNTLKEAILVIPKVPTLWIDMAELEEQSGDVASALEILRLCFEQIPSPFTFCVLQKFIRRKEGRAAARRFFSNTVLLRSEGILGLEVYVAHAALELRVNNEPSVALRVLTAARDQVPTAFSNIAYIKTLTEVLVRLGDFRQLRWVFEANVGLLDVQQKAAHKFSPDEEADLWQQLLEAEIAMGMSDTPRLVLLQERVRFARAECDKFSDPSLDKIDLFEPVQQLYARYNDIVASLPDCDAALRVRVGGVVAATKDTDERGAAGHRLEHTGDGRVAKRRRRGDEAGSSQEVELAGVPIFLRELLLALPPLNGLGPSSDAFIDQLRKTVLPPRPVSEKCGSYSDSILGFGSGQDNPAVAAFGENKRKISSINEEPDDRDDSFVESKHDVFRQRRKVKIDPN